MKRTMILLALFVFPGIKLAAQTGSDSPQQRAKAMLAKMTLEEKVGQMTQITLDAFLKYTGHQVNDPHQADPEKLREAIRRYKIGSILNVGGEAQTLANWQGMITSIQQIALEEHLKIPILYGIDAIHGNNYTRDAVLFPQQIAQAATFNPEMVRQAAEVTAYETRAAFIPWTFSPVLDLGRQPVWPRIWETYGEDPYLVTVMGKAAIQGYQGRNLADRYHVAACLKHYMGYSMPLSGHDRSPAWIPERELREYFLPQFAAAVQSGARTVMVNSGEINGLPVHADHHILTDILKGELGFSGFAVSDWQDIQYLYLRHHIAKDNKEAVMIAVNAGIDMSMVPLDFTFCDALTALVREGRVPLSRIDDAVQRILTVKYELGLFEHPYGRAADYPDFNSAAHQQLSYAVAAESMTLLKNNSGLLPLKAGQKILVTGPSAGSMTALNGGWSRNWQGTSSDQTESGKNTILEAMQETFGKNNVSYAAGSGFDTTASLEEAVAKARQADVVVLCIGENSYTETPGNINDLTLPAAQLALAEALSRTGKPLVFVLTEGRPRCISAIEPYAGAVLHAFLGGNEAGNVVAGILSGKINPSGRLPYTYPRYPNALQNYYHKYTESQEFDPAGGFNPQWDFGTGLSYTTFSYSNLVLSAPVMDSHHPLKVSITVRNTGSREGKETVLLYVSDLVASVTPEVKRLRAFDKISLKPGESKTLTFSLDAAALSFMNRELKRVTEPGEFKLAAGDQTATFTYH